MDIRVATTPTPPTVTLDPATLPFGRTFSPNMFMIDYEEGRGWYDARIVPYGPLMLAPSAMVFHYGQEIFEGLKAFRHQDGSVFTFRPDRNAARMCRSARRMSMPELPVDDQLQAMRMLVDLDRDWVPRPPGSLYIRPTMIATEEALGVHSSKHYLYFIITGPTGPYFRIAGRAVRIMVERDYVRSAPGGTGAAKTGGNYAASLLASANAKAKGCDQVLWLDARERSHVEEVGAMNLIFVLDGVVTTPPASGTILEGITRESVKVLCHDLGLPFVERQIHIEEVLSGLETGDCSEIFGCGTAAVVSSVGELVDGDRTFRVGDGGEGPIAARLRAALTGIQCGLAPDTHDWLVRI